MLLVRSCFHWLLWMWRGRWMLVLVGTVLLMVSWLCS